MPEILTQLGLGNIQYGTGDEREREREACYKPPAQHLSASSCCASLMEHQELVVLMSDAGARDDGWRRRLRRRDSKHEEPVRRPSSCVMTIDKGHRMGVDAVEAGR
jgi:hypothetical protein